MSASVTSTITNNISKLEMLSVQLSEPLEKATYDKESLIYLSMTKSLLLGQDYLSAIIPKDINKNP
jgi:hypothetical protein